MRKSKNKKPNPTEVESLARDAGSLVALLSRRLTIAETKAMFLDRIVLNGANLESLAEKLRWDMKKLRHVLDLNTDVDMRTIADLGTALGIQVSFTAAEKGKPTTHSFSWTAQQ